MQQAMNELKQAVQEARNEMNEAIDEMEINLTNEIGLIRAALTDSSPDDEEE